MKRLHRSGIAFTVAGGALLTTAIKQLVLVGIIDFVLIVFAHLVLAIGVGLFVLSTIAAPTLRWITTFLWAGGWLALHAVEATMLLFVLPPPWLLPAAEGAIVLGSALGIHAFAHHGGRATVPAITTRSVALFAVLSSATIWMFRLVEGVLPNHAEVGTWLRVSADFAAAGAILWFGMLLVRLRATRDAVGD